VDVETRTELAWEFGSNFSEVRVHADGAAARLAADLKADAFTRGNDIYFGPGAYDPRTPRGGRLLRHELAHVLQQGHNEVSTYSGTVVPHDHPSETDAGSGVALQKLKPTPSVPGVTLQRQAAGVPIASGPERRVPIAAGPERRVPIAHGGSDEAAEDRRGELDIVESLTIRPDNENRLDRIIVKQDVGKSLMGPHRHAKDESVYYLNPSGLRAHLSQMTGPLNLFEEGLIGTWGHDGQDQLTPLICIGRRGIVGYIVDRGGTGMRIRTIYTRRGDVLRQTSSEVPLVNMGLGAIDWAMLIMGAGAIGRVAVAELVAKRAVASEAAEIGVEMTSSEQRLASSAHEPAATATMDEPGQPVSGSSSGGARGGSGLGPAPRPRRLQWGRWEDYPKVKRGGREYAQVGDRLYTDHAVERMGPGGTAPSAQSPGQTKLEAPKGPRGDVAYQRRGVSPNYVEDVIERGAQTKITGPSGVSRIRHTLGTVDVVTEDNGQIVITIVTR